MGNTFNCCSATQDGTGAFEEEEISLARSGGGGIPHLQNTSSQASITNKLMKEHQAHSNRPTTQPREFTVPVKNSEEEESEGSEVHQEEQKQKDSAAEQIQPQSKDMILSQKATSTARFMVEEGGGPLSLPSRQSSRMRCDSEAYKVEDARVETPSIESEKDQENGEAMDQAKQIADTQLTFQEKESVDPLANTQSTLVKQGEQEQDGFREPEQAKYYVEKSLKDSDVIQQPHVEAMEEGSKEEVKEVESQSLAQSEEVNLIVTVMEEAKINLAKSIKCTLDGITIHGIKEPIPSFQVILRREDVSFVVFDKISAVLSDPKFITRLCPLFASASLKDDNFMELTTANLSGIILPRQATVKVNLNLQGFIMQTVKVAQQDQEQFNLEQVEVSYKGENSTFELEVTVKGYPLTSKKCTDVFKKSYAAMIPQLARDTAQRMTDLYLECSL